MRRARGRPVRPARGWIAAGALAWVCVLGTWVDDGARARDAAVDPGGGEARARLPAGEVDRIRDAARRILAAEQFRHVMDEAPRFEPADRKTYYLNRAAAWLQRLGTSGLQGIVIACLAVLAGTGTYVVRLLRRLLAAPEGLPIPMIEPAPLTLEPEEARWRARAAAATGDYRHALRHLHRFMRLELDRRGLIPAHESWTNREYLEALSRAGVPVEPLEAFTARCDRVFYGGGEGTREDYQASIVALGELFGAQTVEPDAFEELTWG